MGAAIGPLIGAAGAIASSAINAATSGGSGAEGGSGYMTDWNPNTPWGGFTDPKSAEEYYQNLISGNLPQNGAYTGKVEQRLDDVNYGVERLLGMQAPSNPFVHDQRLNDADARAQYQGALGMLGRYASGQDSVAQAAGEAERQKAMAAIRSLAASQRGFDPAAQRQAILSAAGMQQGMASDIAAARENEMAQARNAYMQSAAQGRQLDQSMFGQELGAQAQAADWYKNMVNQALGYSGAGMGHEQAAWNSYNQSQQIKAGLEGDKMNAAANAANTAENARQFNMGQRNANIAGALKGIADAGQAAAQNWPKSQPTPTPTPAQQQAGITGSTTVGAAVGGPAAAVGAGAAQGIGTSAGAMTSQKPKDDEDQMRVANGGGYVGATRPAQRRW